MGFAWEGVWVMGYCGPMGYGMHSPAHQVGGWLGLWVKRGYGLPEVWVKRGSTVYTDTNGGKAESNCQAPPITIQIGAFNAGRFHALVASLVGAIQNNMLDS